MKIKVYVDWDQQTVISEAEYKEKIQRETERLITTTKKEYFYDWLEDNYTVQAVWEMTEEVRAAVQELWRRECETTAEIETTFEMVELEI